MLHLKGLRQTVQSLRRKKMRLGKNPEARGATLVRNPLTAADGGIVGSLRSARPHVVPPTPPSLDPGQSSRRKTSRRRLTFMWASTCTRGPATQPAVRWPQRALTKPRALRKGPMISPMRHCATGTKSGAFFLCGGYSCGVNRARPDTAKSAKAGQGETSISRAPPRYRSSCSGSIAIC